MSAEGYVLVMTGATVNTATPREEHIPSGSRYLVASTGVLIGLWILWIASWALIMTPAIVTECMPTECTVVQNSSGIYVSSSWLDDACIYVAWCASPKLCWDYGVATTTGYTLREAGLPLRDSWLVNCTLPFSGSTAKCPKPDGLCKIKESILSSQSEMIVRIGLLVPMLIATVSLVGAVTYYLRRRRVE